MQQRCTATVIFQVIAALLLLVIEPAQAQMPPSVTKDQALFAARVGAFGRSERQKAIADARTWAEQAPKLFDGELFANSRYRVATAGWRKYAELTGLVMVGAIPLPTKAEKSSADILFYNPILDIGFFGRYVGDEPNYKLSTGFFVPGEILRGSTVVSEVPAWGATTYFTKGIPKIVSDTLISIALGGDKARSYYDYFKAQLDAASVDAIAKSQARVVALLQGISDKSLECGTQISAVANDPVGNARTIPGTNLNKYGSLAAKLAPWKPVAGFKTNDEAESVRFYAGRMPDVMLLVRATGRGNNCKVQDVGLFDIESDFTKAIETDTKPSASQGAPNGVGTLVAGEAKVISTSVIEVAGTRLNLEGIDGLDGLYAKSLEMFIKEQGGRVSCKGTIANRFRCTVGNNVDLSAAVLLNGSGRLASGAPDDLRIQEQRARDRRIGVWAAPSK